MKKYGIYLGMAAMICLSFMTIGCENYEKKPSYISRAPQKECRICGNGKNSLKRIYKNCTGVGILCLNDWRVVQIQSSEDTLISSNNTSYIWDAKNAYSIKLHQIQTRKISLMQYISSKNNTPNMKKLSSILCHKCLKNVKEAVHIYGKHEDRAVKAVCMIAFPSMKLYGLQQSFQYYFIGDYYVQACCKNDEINLTVFLTPET